MELCMSADLLDCCSTNSLQMIDQQSCLHACLDGAFHNKLGGWCTYNTRCRHAALMHYCLSQAIESRTLIDVHLPV